MYSLLDLTKYFLKLGSTGFGGPVALVGYMHRDLVENKKWISEEDYKEGLALSQLAPGPLAAQLAIYLGYVHHGIIGATVAGFAFVIPSFLMVLALGWLYKTYEGLSWMQTVFYGVSAGVISIITISAYKLTQKSLVSAKDYYLWAIFAISAATTFITETESVWLFLGAGVIYWIVKSPPTFLSNNKTASFAPFLLSTNLWKIGAFFTKAGAFVFGSGLAIVPFLYSGVVKEYGWLNEKEFLDSVAVAMITPGPVVITVGFIGYLVEGFSGAIVAALATFLPCYLFTILPAPYFKKYGKNPAIKAFIDGVTAAAIGAIVGAVILLSKRSLTDIGSISIAVLGIIALLKFKKLQEPVLILAAVIVGVVIKFGLGYFG